jgi:hypothetical protein
MAKALMRMAHDGLGQVWAHRRDRTGVDYDNLKPTNGVSGFMVCATDAEFEEHMRNHNTEVVWVDDLEKAWEDERARIERE